MLSDGYVKYEEAEVHTSYMLAVKYQEAATDVTLPVTLLGCDHHLSFIKSSTSRFITPVMIAISSWCAQLLSDLIVTPCHSLSCDQHN